MVRLSEGGADAQRLEELTLSLRRELLELDVEDVELPRGGTAPAGSRALDVAAVGALLVTLTSSARTVTSVVDTVRRWLARSPRGRTVELTIGDRSLRLEGASREQQERLVEQFLRSVDGT
ncbi:hypothetical protein BH20ACT6_BH20ACT6_05350 [soil metagenome]